MVLEDGITKEAFWREYQRNERKTTCIRKNMWRMTDIHGDVYIIKKLDDGSYTFFNDCRKTNDTSYTITLFPCGDTVELFSVEKRGRVYKSEKMIWKYLNFALLVNGLVRFGVIE